MSQRDRHASGGAVTAEPVPDGTGAGVRMATERAWDDYFPALPAAERQRLLDLAREQGFLAAEQLNPPPTTSAPC
jgi:hypothetical protein